MVRELGPVLTSLMVAGRNSSGMASELGSMKVTEQIDAMRALGTDPYKKLVTPRVVATVFMLFFLTILSDLVGLVGGYIISYFKLGIDTFQYWNSAYQQLTYNDVITGLVKPIFFGFIIATVGCYYGINTKGGTQGVGRSTTQAVVAASVLILAVDVILTQFLLELQITVKWHCWNSNPRRNQTPSTRQSSLRMSRSVSKTCMCSIRSPSSSSAAKPK